MQGYPSQYSPNVTGQSKGDQFGTKDERIKTEKEGRKIYLVGEVVVSWTRYNYSSSMAGPTAPAFSSLRFWSGHEPLCSSSTRSSAREARASSCFSVRSSPAATSSGASCADNMVMAFRPSAVAARKHCSGRRLRRPTPYSE